MKNLRYAVFALLLFAGSCYAQDTFKLNVLMQDEGSFCFVRQAAIDIANGGDPRAAKAILIAHLEGGSCVVMKAMITYSRKIYQHGNIRVYEGKVGAITIFNPTLDIAEGEDRRSDQDI